MSHCWDKSAFFWHIFHFICIIIFYSFCTFHMFAGFFLKKEKFLTISFNKILDSRPCIKFQRPFKGHLLVSRGEIPAVMASAPIVTIDCDPRFSTLKNVNTPIRFCLSEKQLVREVESESSVIITWKRAKITVYNTVLFI